MEPRWSVALFDLHGTLVNNIPLLIGAYQHAVRGVVGIELPEHKIRQLLGQPLIDNCRTLAGDRAAEAYAHYVQWMVDHSEDLLQAYPGMDTTIETLKAAGLKVGVCTNKRLDAAVRAMRSTGLTGVLPILTTYDDTPAPKPHAAPLLHGLQQVGGTPEQTAYIGDAVVDINAAKAAGMASIAVTWGVGTVESLSAAQPDFVIDSQEQLRDLLLGETVSS